MASKREIILKFALSKIDAAEAAAKRVLVSVQKSRDIAKETKNELLSGARDKLKEIRTLKSDLLDRDRGLKRALSLQSDNRGQLGDTSFDTLFPGLASLRSGFRPTRNVIQDVADIASGNSTAALLGIAHKFGGPLGALAASIIGPLTEYVDKKIQEEIAFEMKTFSSELEERRYQSDYARRLEEEPAFRRREAQRSFEEVKREEEAYRRAGWAPSSDFLESF